MENTEVKIECVSCGKTFNFSVREQKFYEEHQYHPPKRCPMCRFKRRQLEEQKNGK